MDKKPGIFSARWAGPKGDFNKAIKRVYRELNKIDKNWKSKKIKARFVCALVYMKHGGDPCPFICQGEWQGSIIDTPRGEFGFGYDPVFFVPELNCTSAELAPDKKNELSHRGKAVMALREHFQS